MRFFTGHESWVFRAPSVAELCGHHAELIASATQPAEPLAYLLSSLLREVSAGPFGVAGPCGSHALAVTRVDPPLHETRGAAGEVHGASRSSYRRTGRISSASSYTWGMPVGIWSSTSK
jgi:hypothetical protein